jgi:hypothetical protein
MILQYANWLKSIYYIEPIQINSMMIQGYDECVESGATFILMENTIMLFILK